MKREVRLLLPAVTIGAYALVLFSAAGFFFSNYNELAAACSKFSPADCRANESVIVSLVSLKIGTVVFFLMGSCAWLAASYLGIKWFRFERTRPLP